MDDWDPFADPGDAEPAPAAKAPAPKPISAVVRKADDIFAALRAEAEEEEKAPAGSGAVDVQQRLDTLFGMDDEEVELLRQEFAGVTADCGGQHFFPMWRRALPLLEKTEAPCSNLLGLMIDDCVGLLADPSSNGKQAVHVALPEGKASNEVVFVLAWGGGSLMDIQDLVEVYREIMPGCTIFMSTSNQKNSFGLRRQCAVGIRAATDAWASSSAKPKLLVHLFSNSGMHTWTELLQAWGSLSSSANLEEQGISLAMPLPPIAEVLRGVILDSAPDGSVPLDACIQSLVQSVAAVVSLAVSSNHDGSEEARKEAEISSKRAVSAIIAGSSVVKAHLYRKPGKMLTKKASADTVVVHSLEPPVPMQFIYSKDDNIILAPGVERYLQEVNERPSRQGLAKPRVWCIEKSRHCMHKLSRPEEYRKCLTVFAQSTMG